MTTHPAAPRCVEERKGMTSQQTSEKLCTIYGGTNSAAQAVGLNRVTFSRIRAGHLIPSPSLAAHLERELARIERYQA